MTLNDLSHMYSTDEQCRALLKKLRWPYGVECLRCKSKKVFELAEYAKFECGECHYQFSVTTQTIFHDTHLPLETWLMAVLLLVEARKGISANQIKRTLSIGSYKTAWYLCHRIRKAMQDVELTMMDGTVEVDETYIGASQKGHSKPGFGDSKKQIVVGIRQRGGDLRFFHAEDAKSGTLAKYVRENISADVEVLVTDELQAYKGVAKEAGIAHETVCHGAREYVRGDVYTNTIESAFSLLKRGIVGTWHKVSAKHLTAYLDEMTWRFNNRKNEFLFRDTMLKLIQSDNLEYKELTKAA